jgi:hypothetical protein
VLPFVVLLAGSLALSRTARRTAWALVILGIAKNSLGVLINRMAFEKIAISAKLPRRAHLASSGQLPGHLWLLCVSATTPVSGHEESSPFWKSPPWIGYYPQCVPPPYRDSQDPIWNPWPVRVSLPAAKWTRKENGYMRGLLELAIMRIELRNPRRALELLDRGLALNGRSPEFLAAKGMVFLTQGDVAGAFAYFDRSVQADPEYDLGLFGKGLSLEAMGNNAAARESYLRVLAAPQGTLDKKEVQARMDRLPR